MQSPLISIIIPTFNAAATLSVALDSIVHQTFKNWELIIMDGVSTDTTIEISKKYQNQFPTNIRISSEKDKGIYDAMNKGIDIAQGDWLYFMGSDDSLYETTTLENIVTLLGLNKYDVVYGNVTSPRFNGVYDGEFTYSKLAEQNICHQAIFLNKVVFKKIGKFNLRYKAHADWDHNIRWFFSSKVSKIFIDLIIASYADGGVSSNGDSVFKKDINGILLKYGIGKLTNSKLIDICNTILNNESKNKIKLYKLGFQILNKIEKYAKKI